MKLQNLFQSQAGWLLMRESWTYMLRINPNPNPILIQKHAQQQQCRFHAHGLWSLRLPPKGVHGLLWGRWPLLCGFDMEMSGPGEGQRTGQMGRPMGERSLDLTMYQAGRGGSGRHVSLSLPSTALRGGTRQALWQSIVAMRKSVMDQSLLFFERDSIKVDHPLVVCLWGYYGCQFLLGIHNCSGLHHMLLTKDRIWTRYVVVVVLFHGMYNP